MPAPSDSTPDFNWIKRQLGDSAVLPAPSDGTQAAYEPSASGEETHVLESETVVREPAKGQPGEIDSKASSESAIRDVKVSDASILEDDAPLARSPDGDASDVILRNDMPDDWNREEFDTLGDDAPEGTPSIEASQDIHAEAAGITPDFSTTPESSPAGAGELLKAFDLETPITAAEFPAPYTAEDGITTARPRSLSARADAGASESSPKSTSFGRILLISYASAITLVCLFLVLQMLRDRAHQLESLPDIPPLNEGETQFYPVDAILPNGHLLTLGESRRFGDILVEPLKVTYGPLQYEHWTGEASRVRPPSEESVVKLWLRFTNLSQKQSIAPFDPRLVLESRFRSGEMLTNNFLRRANSTKLELMYDLPPASEWELQDQYIGEVLEPGQSFETYAATDFEHLADILGQVGSESHDLVWRLHVRKGFGPSGNGVTTLVDIAFNSNAIEPEG